MSDKTQQPAQAPVNQALINDLRDVIGGTTIETPGGMTVNASIGATESVTTPLKEEQSNAAAETAGPLVKPDVGRVAPVGMSITEMLAAKGMTMPDTNTIEMVKPDDSEIALPVIRIKNQANVFQIEIDGKIKEVSEFQGMIVPVMDGLPKIGQVCNAYWKQSYSERPGSAPDCSSKNGVYPDGASPVNEVCVSGKSKSGDIIRMCPYNEFGTGPNGEGKACTNLFRLHVLLPGAKIPYRLTLTPGRLKAIKDLGDFFIMKRDVYTKHFFEYLYNFKCVTQKNKKQIDYTGINITVIGDGKQTVYDIMQDKELAKQMQMAIAGIMLDSSTQQRMTNEEIAAEEMGSE